MPGIPLELSVLTATFERSSVLSDATMVGRLQARNPKSSFSSGRTRAYDRTQDSLLFQNVDGIYAAHSKNVEDDRISCRANSIARFPVVLLAEISEFRVWLWRPDLLSILACGMRL